MSMQYYLILLFIIISGCATQLPPAGPNSMPMERANQIIIRTQDDPTLAYRGIASILTDQGFIISSSDAILFNITTERQHLPASFMVESITSRATVQISSQIRTQGGTTTVVLTGRIWMGGAERRIRHETRSGQDRNSWNALQKIASSYPGGRVLYARN